MNFPAFLPELWLGFLILALLLLDIRWKEESRHSVLAITAGLGALLTLPILLWQSSLTPADLLGGMYRVDGLAVFFKAIFAISAAMVILMTRQMEQTLPRAHGEYYVLLLTATLGMFFAASSANFLMLFISIELIAITFYVLTSYLQTDLKSLEAGMKYMILGSLASGFFLYGIAFVYGSTGSMQFSAIQGFLQNQQALSPALLFGLLLILSSMAFKVAAVPFQLWVPDVYQGAPTSATAFLSVGSKAAGFVVALRVLHEMFFTHAPQWSILIAWLAGLTILYGNLSAIPQSNIKRLLGYSSIGHAGYILIGIAVSTVLGSMAVHFYLLGYAFTNLAIFLAVATVYRHIQSDEMKDYAGLSQRSPFLAAVIFISLLSLAGVPPLAGFFGKFLLLMSAVWKGYLWLALVGAAAVVISLYYYLLLVKTMYMDPPQDSSPIPVSWTVRLALLACMAAMLVIGVVQGPFVGLASAAVKSLF